MDLSILENRLGIVFANKGLLKQVITHKSYINENRKWEHGHNERLEFLGDAVLELIVTDYLFQRYPNEREGSLTSYRSSLVGQTAVAQQSLFLGLEEHLLMANGELRSGGRTRDTILGDVFEAIIAAIYLDQGYQTARSFVMKTLLLNADKTIKDGFKQDSKTRLQEAAQKYLQLTPRYQILEESGPDHNKQFVVGVYFGSDLLATGKGRSKKLAEVEAANAALVIKEWKLSLSS